MQRIVVIAFSGAIALAAYCVSAVPSIADPASIEGVYPQGELVRLEVTGRRAYLIKPTGNVDPERRWIWVGPFWLAVNEKGMVSHRMYVDRYLAAGFHVAGVDVGKIGRAHV